MQRWLEAWLATFCDVLVQLWRRLAEVCWLAGQLQPAAPHPSNVLALRRQNQCAVGRSGCLHWSPSTDGTLTRLTGWLAGQPGFIVHVVPYTVLCTAAGYSTLKLGKHRKPEQK